MARDKVNHTHGDSGTKPDDGEDFQTGEIADPETFDWLFNTLPDTIDGHADEFTRLDSDNDGVVDEADYANDADASSYKGNDLDSDGDGKVDDAEQADNATTLQGLGPTDLKVDIEDGGTQLLNNVTSLNVGSGLSVADDGDGTVTVSTTHTTDTHIGIDDSGAAVLNDIDRLEVGANISATDNGDGTVTIYSDDDATSYKGNDLDTDGDGKVDNAEQADNAANLGGSPASEYVEKGEQADRLILEVRSGDPNSPQDGRIWFNTNG